MSNIYIQEPPALGKVLLKTSAGDIDIELWTKEAPKACRNFIQLCMEGYYNGTIFHRVVPGFIVQGGDPNGDGTGGESIYGEPFKDEFHSRLRFNRRGLVAMANAGKDDNGSQFFFTLAATPELQNKHTIFGKVTGETIYNMLKLAEGLIGPDDRPDHPHKVKSASVLINPFEDIVPRVREAPAEVAPKKKKKEVKAVKNFGLLSFGEEAEEEEDEAQEYKGKPKSTHDLLDDPKLSKKTAAELEEEQSQNAELSSAELEKIKEETATTVSSIRDKLRKRERSPEAERDSSEERDSKIKKESESEEEYYIGKERDMERRKERDRIRNEIKQLKKDMRDSKAKQEKEVEKNQTEEEREKKLEEDNEMYKQYVEEQEKYKKMKEKIPKKGAARVRCNNVQLRLLVDYMAKHRSFANGEFSRPRTTRQHHQQWKALRTMLKKHGPNKTVKQWRHTWRDLKRKAKDDDAKIRKARTATGKHIPSLSEINETILSIIGLEMASGIGDSEETSVGSSLVQQSMTSLPTTSSNTALPIKSLPTTSLPITSRPTTSLLITLLPTTSLPITSLPTTSLPTTSLPNTTQSPCGRNQTAVDNLIDQVVKDEPVVQELQNTPVDTLPRISTPYQCSVPQPTLSQCRIGLGDRAAEQATTYVLKDISYTLKTRNEIMQERNKILALGNRLQSREWLRQARKWKH